MKILIVLGSPRKGGNGETLVRKAAEAMNRVEARLITSDSMI